LALIGDEGRIKRRNASVSCKKALTWRSPNRATLKTAWWIYSQVRANPVNWNILVAGGIKSKSDFLSSGERNGISLNRIFGVVGQIFSVWLKENLLEGRALTGDSPISLWPYTYFVSQVA